MKLCCAGVESRNDNHLRVDVSEYYRYIMIDLCVRSYHFVHCKELEDFIKAVCVVGRP